MAREAQTDEVRASYLQLAQVWLDTASKRDGLPPTRIPSPDEPATTMPSASDCTEHREARRGLTSTLYLT
jgi:hypothetical protein